MDTNHTTLFWACYVIYIILALVAIILTGMVLKHGSKAKPLIWILYVINILLLIATSYFLFKGSEVIGGILLCLQFICNLAALIVTHREDNLVVMNPSEQKSVTAMYTSSIVFAILSFLFGLGTVFVYRTHP